MRRILVCQPRGFCAGVARAIHVIDELLETANETIYVRKEVVHNRTVVDGFKERGVVFVNEADEAPEGGLLVFSAHGVSPDVRQRSHLRAQRTIDATCPLVTKVHREVQRFIAEDCCVFLVGHAGHEEVDGILGHGGGNIHLIQNEDDARSIEVADPSRVAVVTQTTLSIRESRDIIAVLKERFPQVREPARSDICYATENRQSAVRALSEHADAIVVIGSQNSSNSRSLRDVARSCGVNGYLVDDPDAIDPRWLAGVGTLGITAGASSPETLVQSIIAAIREIEPEFSTIETVGTPEPAMNFRKPHTLAPRSSRS